MKDILYIGLSTHRRIAHEALPQVEQATRQVLADVKASCEKEGKTLVMLNSLAEGGDTICAQAALVLGIPYIALLPRPKESYAEDFEKEALALFLSLCDQAEDIILCPDVEGKNQTDYDYLYRQASIYIATLPDIFLALWDGVPGKKGGCGAAEAVDFACNRGFENPNGTAPVKERKIIHILTPRAGTMQENAGKVSIFTSSDPTPRPMQ